MSIEALKWVFEDAPDVPAHLVSTLIGLANHAGPDGKGAYPAVGRLARYTRKSIRSVQRELRQLVALGLIREGDQRYVLHVPAGARPIVYELAVERVQSRDDAHVTLDTHVTPDTGVTPDHSGDDADVTPGVTPASRRGDVGVTLTVLNQEPPPPRAAARTRDPLAEAEEAEDFEKATTIIAAEELVASLPGPLSQGQQRQLVPIVAAALEAGWPPKELYKELTVDVGNARSRYAVYAHRLGPLPTSRPPARPAAPAATHHQPQHEFEPDAYGKSCTRCHTAKTNTVHIALGAPESITA